jgi:hypothetical protein
LAQPVDFEARNPRDQDETFRYAALSSSLDIVRKALGGHQIARVQARRSTRLHAEPSTSTFR